MLFIQKERNLNMGDSNSGSSAVSIFAMVLLTLVVLLVLYFVVFKGVFSNKTNVDVNVKPGGSLYQPDNSLYKL